MKTLSCICIMLLIFSCSNSKKDKLEGSYSSYSLKKSKELVFNINNTIDYIILALFPFEDENKNEYITLQNRTASEILFYPKDTNQPPFSVKIDRQGPNGVPNFLGYHVKGYDEIYLTTPGLSHITRVDTSGRILQKIEYGVTDEGLHLVPSYTSATIPYTPLVIIGSKFYFTQVPMPGQPVDKWPVSGYVDTLNHTVKAHNLFFPPIIKDEEKYTMGIGPEMSFSMCYNEKEFVYAFIFDNEIIVASEDHKTISRKLAKSKYIDKLTIEKRPGDMVSGAKRMNEAPFYGNLLYDKFRKVYYRIAYPETEMDNNEDHVEIWKTGRKRFSIVILNEDFEIIGETLFPDYTYFSKEMFVDKDGLYIRNNHHKNPNFDEDILSFACFELVKME